MVSSKFEKLILVNLKSQLICWRWKVSELSETEVLTKSLNAALIFDNKQQGFWLSFHSLCRFLK